MAEKAISTPGEGRITPPELQAEIDALSKVKSDKVLNAAIDVGLITALTIGYVKINAGLNNINVDQISKETWGISFLTAMAMVGMLKNAEGNAEIALVSAMMGVLVASNVPWKEVKNKTIDVWWDVAKYGSPVGFVLDKLGYGDDVKGWLSGVIG